MVAWAVSFLGNRILCCLIVILETENEAYLSVGSDYSYSSATAQKALRLKVGERRALTKQLLEQNAFC